MWNHDQHRLLLTYREASEPQLEQHQTEGQPTSSAPSILTIYISVQTGRCRKDFYRRLALRRYKLTEARNDACKNIKERMETQPVGARGTHAVMDAMVTWSELWTH